MQIEIINNNNVFKTWYRNYEPPAGNQCVRPSVRSIAFHTAFMTLDTYKSVNTAGLAHCSQFV